MMDVVPHRMTQAEGPLRIPGPTAPTEAGPDVAPGPDGLYPTASGSAECRAELREEALSRRCDRLASFLRRSAAAAPPAPWSGQWGGDDQVNPQLAAPPPSHVRDPVARAGARRARRRAGRDLDLLVTVEGLDRDGGTENRLGERDRHGHDQIVALALERSSAAHRQVDVEVARRARPAPRPGPAPRRGGWNRGRRRPECRR